MTYEEYVEESGKYYPYQTDYRNTELKECVKIEVSETSDKGVDDYIIEYSLGEDPEDYTTNKKVLGSTMENKRAFLYKDILHLLMSHENEDIDEYIAWYKNK